MRIGLWGPDAATAGMVRSAIRARPEEWRAIVADLIVDQPLELVGDSLRRPPRGIDPDHPMIDDLRRKDFAAALRLTQARVTAPGFLDDFVSTCRAAVPFLDFLAQATGVQL